MPSTESFAKQDPLADMRFPHVRASKTAEERGRLRKLASLTYLRGKLHDMFHREHRDTIVCEEDEESPAGSARNIYDILRHSELSGAHRVRPGRAQTTSGRTKFDAASFAQTAPSGTTCARYEPSKEQRWCTNCSKCFQRGLSHYDQYCGLDCKTAHRLRQSA